MTDESPPPLNPPALTMPPLPGAGPGPASPGVPTSDEKTLAMLTHVLAIFTGLVGPLILYLIKKKESAFVAGHAAEALNLQLTRLILLFGSMTVAFPLLLIPLIGLIPFGLAILLNGAFAIYMVVIEIIAAIKANEGVEYRYPLNFRIIR